jgi:hypothetical protein
MKLKFLFLLSLILTSLHAVSDSAFVPSAELANKDPNQIWYWTEFSFTNEGKNYIADFTKIDKLDADTFLVPYSMGESKKLVYQKNAYLKIDCKNRIVIELGGFTNGKFERNIVAQKGTVGYEAAHFVCGTKNYRGVLRSASLNLESLQHIGWVDEELVQSDNDPSLVQIILYTYVASIDQTTGTIVAGIRDIDCNRKVMIDTLPNKQKVILDPNDSTPNNSYLRVMHVINHACEFYKNKSTALKIKESNSSKLLDARQKCKDLGFKEKTEKFGTCVLELTK